MQPEVGRRPQVDRPQASPSPRKSVLSRRGFVGSPCRKNRPPVRRSRPASAVRVLGARAVGAGRFRFCPSRGAGPRVCRRRPEASSRLARTARPRPLHCALVDAAPSRRPEATRRPVARGAGSICASPAPPLTRTGPPALSSLTASHGLSILHRGGPGRKAVATRPRGARGSWGYRPKARASPEAIAHPRPPSPRLP